MSTDLAILDPNQMQAAIEYAERLSYSVMIPDAYQGKPANILWAMEYGRTLGLSTVATINGVNVIKGKPTASAALISALVRQAGHRMRIGFDAATMTGWATIVRADDPDFTFRSEWDLERAVEAELCKIKDGKPFAVDSKGNTLPWKKFYPSMVKARAITEVARDACEEVLFGLHYTPQELGAEVDEDGTPVVVQVQQVPESAPAPAVPLRVPQPARPHSPAGLERDRPARPAEDEWTQPAPTNVANSNVGQQIEDAEIVPEPRQSVQGQHIAISQLFAQKHGVTTRDRKLAGVAHYLHHPVTSTKELTYDEAAELIATLSALPDYRPKRQEAAPVNTSDSSAAAVAEAQKLAPGEESEAMRLEADLLDGITSASSPTELDAVMTGVYGRHSDESISAAALARLRDAGVARGRVLESQRVAPQGAPVAVGAAA